MRRLSGRFTWASGLWCSSAVLLPRLPHELPGLHGVSQSESASGRQPGAAFNPVAPCLASEKPCFLPSCVTGSWCRRRGGGPGRPPHRRRDAGTEGNPGFERKAGAPTVDSCFPRTTRRLCLQANSALPLPPERTGRPCCVVIT